MAKPKHDLLMDANSYMQFNCRNLILEYEREALKGKRPSNIAERTIIVQIAARMGNALDGVVSFHNAMRAAQRDRMNRFNGNV